MSATSILSRGKRDPVTTDALLMSTLALALAGFGGVFWLVAGRLHSVATVGVAGTLVTAIMVLSFLAQVGLDRNLLASLPRSDRPRSDFLLAVVVVATIGTVLGTGFAWLLPLLASETAPALSGWRPFGFGLLVGGTAVNLTTDVAFLSLRRVRDNLVITGLGMGLLKCTLPFALSGWGAFGLAVAVGVSSILSAACCVVVVARALAPTRGLRPSAGFRSEMGLGLSGYVSSLVDFVPVLVLPIIVIAHAGPEENAMYFIAFQVVLMLGAAAYSIGNSAFAEASRHPERADEVLRHCARMMAVVVGAGAAVVLLGARPLLMVFGSSYAEGGVATLRLLAMASLAVAAAYWAVTTLRVRRRLVAALAVGVCCAGGSTVIAWLVGGGAEQTALAWLLGHVAGALLGVSLTLRRTSRR